MHLCTNAELFRQVFKLLIWIWTFFLYWKQLWCIKPIKKRIWVIPRFISNLWLKGAKNEKIIKNHVMTSSWRHFKFYKNLPISNNLPSFNMIALILLEIYHFKKGTFNPASRDPRWRHRSETSHIWWLPDGQHMCKFWSDYTKLLHTHLQKVHFEQFSTCR